jgi:hypothetical protein
MLPDIVGPIDATGSRNVLPSVVKVILNLVPVGVAAVNDCPVKKCNFNIAWLHRIGGVCDLRAKQQQEEDCGGHFHRFPLLSLDAPILQ